MAKVQGHTCDMPGCKNFSNDRAGWIPVGRYDEKGERSNPDDDAELCSWVCVMRFGKQAKDEQAEVDAEAESPIDHIKELVAEAQQPARGQRTHAGNGREAPTDTNRPGDVWCKVKGCGDGPFKGPQGLGMHTTRKHSGKKWSKAGKAAG